MYKEAARFKVCRPNRLAFEAILYYHHFWSCSVSMDVLMPGGHGLQRDASLNAFNLIPKE